MKRRRRGAEEGRTRHGDTDDGVRLGLFHRVCERVAFFSFLCV